MMDGNIGHLWHLRVLRLMYSDGWLYRAFRVLRLMYSDGWLYRAFKGVEVHV